MKMRIMMMKNIHLKHWQKLFEYLKQYELRYNLEDFGHSKLTFRCTQGGKFNI